jgi:branched-chain amino acid transport system substrate-binding protein
LIAAGCSNDDGAIDTTDTEQAVTSTAPADDSVASTTQASDGTNSTALDETGGDECGKPAAGEPIRFGHISSLSGPINIPSAGYAVEVAFDRYNECGGFNGRPLELVIKDGGLEPGISAAAARDLVERDRVVGLVGNNAFLDCLNGQYYQDNAVANVGSSFDGACYKSPVIYPTLPNFDRNLFPGIVYALGAEKSTFAYVALDIPGQRAQAQAIKTYLASEGAELTTEIFVPFGSTDANAAMQTIRQADVDVVVMSVDEVLFAAAAAAAVQQGIGPDKKMWIAPAGLYSPRALATLGPAGEGLYVVANYDVAENGNNFAADLRKAILAKHPDAEVDGFAQFGWISAETLLAALDTIKGELTRESLLAAMDAIGPVRSKFLPGPITVNGELPRSVVSQALVLQIKDRTYTVASDGFITYP